MFQISFCNKPNKLKILLRPSKTGRTNTVDNRDFLFQATVTNEDVNKTSETKELIENSINSNEVKLNRNASVRESHEIKQSMEDLHYTSYDGSLTWRVDGFARKFGKYQILFIRSYVQLFFIRFFKLKLKEKRTVE